MAYENTGTARSLYVTITKYVGGNVEQGYPVTYNGQNSWGDVLYPTLTDTQVRQLSDAAFAARLAAFELYVEGLQAGADFTTDIVGTGATKYDPSNCGITTTTTEAPVSVYAFTVKYGTYANDVCTGQTYVVYSIHQYPAIGNTLYKNSELTQKWDIDNYVLFVSPILYSQKAVQVSKTTGKITAISTFDCSAVVPPAEPYLITHIVSTSLTSDPDNSIVSGSLKINGVTKEISAGVSSYIGYYYTNTPITMDVTGINLYVNGVFVSPKYVRYEYNSISGTTSTFTVTPTADTTVTIYVSDVSI